MTLGYTADDAVASDVPRLVWTTAFGIPSDGALRPHTGSPAAVVLYANRLTDASVRTIATDADVETTAVYRSPRPGVDVSLRFWVPGGELAMCVHGLLGAVAALARDNALRHRRCVIETKLGLVTAHWHQDGDMTVVSVDQWPPTFGAPIADAHPVLEALGLDIDDLDPGAWPVQVVSVSRAKLFLPLRDAFALQRARPVPSRIADVCIAHRATGIYAFTCHPTRASHDVEARQFPVGAGFVEDPATGVAAAGLAAYLVTHASPQPVSERGTVRYAILQGEDMGRPCLLEGIAVVSGNRVVGTRVSGRAAVAR